MTTKSYCFALDFRGSDESIVLRRIIIYTVTHMRIEPNKRWSLRETDVTKFLICWLTPKCRPITIEVFVKVQCSQLLKLSILCLFSCFLFFKSS